MAKTNKAYQGNLFSEPEYSEPVGNLEKREAKRLKNREYNKKRSEKKKADDYKKKNDAENKFTRSHSMFSQSEMSGKGKDENVPESIKLTENELYNVIEESVKKIINELDWRTYDSAYNKAKGQAESGGLNKFQKAIRNTQARDFRAAREAAKRDNYNLSDEELKDAERYERGLAPRVPDRRVLRKMSRRTDDIDNYENGRQEYKNGKWQNK